MVRAPDGRLAASAADLNAVVDVTVVATAPWDVILLRAQAAVAVGLLLAVETVCYRARGALLGERWSGEPLSVTVRAFLVVAGGVLFSVGVLLGYDRVVPVVDLPAVPGSGWSVIRLSRVALATATHVTE